MWRGMLSRSQAPRRRGMEGSGRLLLAGTLAVMTLLAAVPAAAQTCPPANFPAPWIPDNQFCGPGEFVDCWLAIPRIGAAIQDPIANPDESHNSNPQPRSADIYAGEEANQDSIWYAYNSTFDIIYFRKRLDGSPSLAVQGGTSPPGDDANGPFNSNTAWNFIMDFDGDGWADIIGATDGNTGKQQDPTDTMRLAYANTPGLQEITNPSLCTAGGQVLFLRKANTVPPVPGCAGQQATTCDYIFTKVINDCPASAGFAPCEGPGPLPACCTDGANFHLMMQFPRCAFDSCSGTDSDADGIGGPQLLEPDTPFSICVTTSTQPNDFTAKDLALNALYNMRKDRPLPCGDPCTLTGGCQQNPLLLDLTPTCGTGNNNSPITLTATVMDTLDPNAGGDSVVDTIDRVEFYYVQEDGMGGFVGGTWTLIGSVMAPNPTAVNLWSISWNTSALSTTCPMGGSCPIYRVRAQIVDDQGNITDLAPINVDLSDPSCGTTSTPVTLASFEAKEEAEGIRVTWTTATETGNAGFLLYARTPAGWRLLTPEPVPSQGVDSTAPQSYSRLLRHLEATELAIQDVDVRGQRRLHGPFALGGTYGTPGSAEAIDWRAVRGEVAASEAPRPGASGLAVRSHAAAPPAVELLVEESGLYRLTYEELLAAGFDFGGVASNEIAVVQGQESVPVRVVAGKTFGPGAFIELYGEAVDSIYTDTNVYTLLADHRRASRVRSEREAPRAQAPGFYMATETVEENLAYSFFSPAGDPWYAARLLSFHSPRQWSFDVELDGVLTDAAPGRLSVLLYGVTAFAKYPDHHVVAYVNGQRVADHAFDGRILQEISAELPAGLLRDGTNTLTLELPGDTEADFDLINLERWSLTYPRAFVAAQGEIRFTAEGRRFRVHGLPGPDVVAYRLDGGEVSYLDGVEVTAEGGGYSVELGNSSPAGTYLVAAAEALRTPGLRPARPWTDLAAGEAEYLIISHSHFLDGLAPLVAARRSQGLSVRVVDVEDVYSQYRGGVFDAGAIRDYIAEAATSMGTRYVLLVGGDTYDYKDYLNLGSVSFIPSLYAATSELVSFAPVDPLYTDLDGDNVPDLAIGRLPVRTTAELDAVLAKILQYGAKSYPRTAVFSADGVDLDAGVSFTEHSEEVIAELPAGWSVERAYLDRSGVAAARQALFDAVDGGVALTSFIGHSGPVHWTFAGLFSSADVDALANAGRPTVVVQWGCWNTYHVEPRYNTLGHRFLLAPDRGAAAVLGSSTLSAATSSEALSRRLAGRVTAPGVLLGDAVTAAKQDLAASQPELLDVLLGWTILGDPALVVEP